MNNHKVYLDVTRGFLEHVATHNGYNPTEDGIGRFALTAFDVEYVVDLARRDDGSVIITGVEIIN